MSFDPLNDEPLDDHTSTVPVAPETPSAPIMTASRIKRNLLDEAINAARSAEWTDAVESNQKILEMGPDVAAQNRLAKALWEQGELAQAREHYQSALALDPTNRIAERNIGRLRFLMAEAGSKTVAAGVGIKASVGIFVEETGKTGFAHLIELANTTDLGRVNPGDLVELTPTVHRLAAKANGSRIGSVEPRVAARLLTLMADGNKYAAGVTSLGDKDVRIIIRETYQDPANYGKVSFPTAARVSDLRPYTKGTLVREAMELDDELEFEEEVDVLESASPSKADVAPGDGFQIVTEDSPVDGDSAKESGKVSGEDS